MSDKEKPDNPQPNENIELPTNEIVQNGENRPNNSEQKSTKSKDS